MFFFLVCLWTYATPLLTSPNFIPLYIPPHLSLLPLPIAAVDIPHQLYIFHIPQLLKHPDVVLVRPVALPGAIGRVDDDEELEGGVPVCGEQQGGPGIGGGVDVEGEEDEGFVVVLGGGREFGHFGAHFDGEEK